MNRRRLSMMVAAETFGVLAMTAPMAAESQGVSCPGDTNGDGDVNTDDFLDVLSNWGFCPGCPADTNGDDVIDADDFLTVLASWDRVRNP